MTGTSISKTGYTFRVSHRAKRVILAKRLPSFGWGSTARLPQSIGTDRQARLRGSARSHHVQVRARRLDVALARDRHRRDQRSEQHQKHHGQHADHASPRLCSLGACGHRLLRVGQLIQTHGTIQTTLVTSSTFIVRGSSKLTTTVTRSGNSPTARPMNVPTGGSK